ncbi:hypothetical protein DFJ73DRAFT_125006 [Zopfochytrium polystomum]|nr:hypothetical protein DFJ73DRAFT_125006 [Zopfochytrium polystomum]
MQNASHIPPTYAYAAQPRRVPLSESSQPTGQRTFPGHQYAPACGRENVPYSFEPPQIDLVLSSLVIKLDSLQNEAWQQRHQVLPQLAHLRDQMDSQSRELARLREDNKSLAALVQSLAEVVRNGFSEIRERSNAHGFPAAINSSTERRPCSSTSTFSNDVISAHRQVVSVVQSATECSSNAASTAEQATALLTNVPESGPPGERACRGLNKDVPAAPLISNELTKGASSTIAANSGSDQVAAKESNSYRLFNWNSQEPRKYNWPTFQLQELTGSEEELAKILETPPHQRRLLARKKPEVEENGPVEIFVSPQSKQAAVRAADSMQMNVEVNKVDGFPFADPAIIPPSSAPCPTLVDTSSAFTPAPRKPANNIQPLESRVSTHALSTAAEPAPQSSSQKAGPSSLSTLAVNLSATRDAPAESVESGDNSLPSKGKNPAVPSLTAEAMPAASHASDSGVRVEGTESAKSEAQEIAELFASLRRKSILYLVDPKEPPLEWNNVWIFLRGCFTQEHVKKHGGQFKGESEYLQRRTLCKVQIGKFRWNSAITPFDPDAIAKYAPSFAKSKVSNPSVAVDLAPSRSEHETHTSSSVPSEPPAKKTDQTNPPTPSSAAPVHKWVPIYWIRALDHEGNLFFEHAITDKTFVDALADDCLEKQFNMDTQGGHGGRTDMPLHFWREDGVCPESRLDECCRALKLDFDRSRFKEKPEDWKDIQFSEDGKPTILSLRKLEGAVFRYHFVGEEQRVTDIYQTIKKARAHYLRSYPVGHPARPGAPETPKRKADEAFLDSGRAKIARVEQP